MVNEEPKKAEDEIDSTEQEELEEDVEEVEEVDEEDSEDEELDDDEEDLDEDDLDDEDDEDEDEEDEEENEDESSENKKPKKGSNQKKSPKKGRKSRKKSYKNRLKSSPKIKRIHEEIQNIDDINQLKNVRDKFNDQTGDYINQIKKLQSEINELQDQAYDYKKKRDDLNEKVSKIKDRKYAIIDKLKKVTAELRDAKKEGGETSDGQNWKDVKKKIYKSKSKIEQLERQIETEDLSLGEENKLVDRIDHFEQKLQGLYSLKPKNQFKDYYDKIGKYKEELEQIKDDLAKLADESQNWHLLYIDLSKEINELQNEKNLLQRELNENKYVADIYHNRLVEVSQVVKKEKLIEKKSQYRNKKKAKKEIRKITLQDAKEKLEKGKKLNIFEARAIMEDRVRN